MPWLLTSSGIWIGTINRLLCCTRKDFNNLCHFRVEKWEKMQMYFILPEINSGKQRLQYNTNGLVQDCSALPMEILQSGTKPSILHLFTWNFQLMPFTLLFINIAFTNALLSVSTNHQQGQYWPPYIVLSLCFHQTAFSVDFFFFFKSFEKFHRRDEISQNVCWPGMISENLSLNRAYQFLLNEAFMPVCTFDVSVISGGYSTWEALTMAGYPVHRK